ncbi:short chain dehydrogenase reductase [Grosmannia clavigera kw1407]|uniref:Short chain dehydrogenase reductase n=1 Tax=Grosmannia clavigera (strain kw1407 / UAMH 11150) TaxID=655863 RepID=F0X727_GROCL|nr:short chain dehydrogenase reductase [Grosmannia clavigera kw1407]EFX06226.1 short chain dehydrogenase reductase [Grosmannia clavigera kw1407]
MVADTLSLAGKTAIVTGSARENGIGAAIATVFARNGASVAIHYNSDNSKPRAEKVAAELSKEFGVKTIVLQGDVAKQDAAFGLVERALKGLGTGHIDILVNNAGYGAGTPLTDLTPEEIQVEFGVNTCGSIYMTQAVVKVGKMPPGGRIINVGTIASKLGLAQAGLYAATKAAQDSLTASWAGELGKSHGITVNTIAPGPVATDLAASILVNKDGTPTNTQQTMLGQTRAAARLGTTQDIADAALLLASEKSRWITAQFISVSGGITGTM